MEKFKKGDLVMYLGKVQRYYGKIFEVERNSIKKDFVDGNLAVFVKNAPAMEWFFAHNLIKIGNIEG